MEAPPSPTSGRRDPPRRGPWLLPPLLSVVALAAAARYLVLTGGGGVLGGGPFATVGAPGAGAPGVGGGRNVTAPPRSVPIPLEAESSREGGGGRNATSSRSVAPDEDGGGGPGDPLTAARCRALRSHEGGRWVHARYGGNHTPARRAPLRGYYPAEGGWLRGVGRPDSFGRRNCIRDPGAGEEGIMYLSLLGNQCGCNTDAFEPSHSTWTTGAEEKAARGRGLSSWSHDGAVRLVRALSGRTMCLVGDSIDLQFYHAVGHGLRRAAALHGLNITVEVGRDAVNYTEETGRSYYGRGFRYLDAVERTDVTIDGGRSAASIRYVKFYGWAPMHLSFADDCDVVVTNLGLHYNETTGRMHNANSNQAWNTLDSDVPALLGWMLDQSSRRPGNVAVWRSALPQHFDTADGHYRKESKRCKPMPAGQREGRTVQAYNRAYERAFARMCNVTTGDDGRPDECAPYEMTCTARRTGAGRSSLHSYYVKSGCCGARRERLEGLPGEVTGRVLRWDVSDLFDVPSWHVDNNDCSHFCYVPGLYGEAFGRLAVLLGGG